jgi:hypothetical protein
MHETAFHFYIGGFIVLVASLPIMVFLKDRWIGWGAVVVAFNFLSQGYMVNEGISLPYIAMPNLVMFLYLLFFFFRTIIKHKQK